MTDNKKAARRRPFQQQEKTDYLEAAVAAAEAAESAAEADAAAAEAEASGAEAAGAGAAIGAGAGAGGVTVVSSFLLQAARATEATKDANRSDFFIFVLNQKVEQLPVIVGPLQFHRAPTLKRPRELEHLNGPACHYMQTLSQSERGGWERFHRALRNNINEFAISENVACISRNASAEMDAIEQSNAH